jgi:alkylation response protein AidB-like acyl-CoA dehydrogenase
MGREELAAFLDLAAAFARRSIAPLLAHESPDGDLAQVVPVLAEAEKVGLLASPDPEAPGHETGIWGRHALAAGPRLSLLLLEELATACAGVAMNAHVIGLGSLLLARARGLSSPLPRRPAAGLGEGGFLPGPAVLSDPSLSAPARIETVAVKRNDDLVLSGRKDFVFRSPDTDAYIVFAREDREWALFLVPADAVGLEVTDAGPRLGLRACPVVHLTLRDVTMPMAQRLAFERPVTEIVMEHLRLWCLGLVAIGAGAARGSLAAARVYAGERWQGCAEIIAHDGTGALLAEAEAGIMVCQGLLERASQEGGSASANLLAAAKARLAGLPAAALAVTNCLQVFGGYGYMEDYRMEKRYRDVNTLKSAGGSGRDLRRLIAGLSREE